MKVNKVIVIGLDAPIAPRLYDYAKEGYLPTMGKLIENGVYAENCLVPFPTITPPNWTTIVTGASLGTHGITCFNVHNPGDPLNVTHQGFDTADCQAEYIWNAAEKVGKKSIIINYPSTWPPTVKEGIQIGGAGLWVNEWRYKQAGVKCTLAGEQLFATEEYPQATTIRLRPAEGWESMPEAKRALEAELPLMYRLAVFEVEPRTWHLLLLDEGDGFKKAIVSESKDLNAAFADLREGEWTPNVTKTFQTSVGERRAVFRLKLLELKPDGSSLRLYVTPLCALEGWGYPEGICGEIKSEDGLPMPHAGFQAFNLEWIDGGTFLEILELAHIWLADAASYLLKNKDWDLYFMHAHCPDHAYHSFATKMDPLTAQTEEQARFYQDIEMKFYQSLDRMIGRIVECSDPDEALVILVSDHGAKATTHRFQVARVLEEAGLLAFRQTEDGRRVIDWSRTKAVQQRSCYIYVNLKGRDPQGIVEPEDYEKVQEEIISALYNYTDPETGKKPIALALRREDARIIGLYGDRVGDVVYAITPDFGGQHGPHLPTARFGLGDLRGLFVMSGPGVKRGEVLKRTVHLEDVVPTICYLAELPVPEHAEGAILYQALEDPNLKLHEMERLRKNYERLQSAFEKEQALEHTYNL